jgi:hypothetical protein
MGFAEEKNKKEVPFCVVSGRKIKRGENEGTSERQ